MLIQAIVNHNYLFTDIYIGWPGRVHDARVLVHSDFYKQAVAVLPSSKSKLIGGVQAPPYIIGDAAYPLKSWLMKPFPQTELTEDMKTYNYRISRPRMVVENAFGRLKGRWRHLIKRCDMTVDKVPNIIAACCVLHNVCELYQEGYDERWSETVRQATEDTPQTNESSADSDTHHVPQGIRNALILHFKSHPIT